MDSVFVQALNYEHHGNDLWMYIISKILLPMMNGLGHSNYSNSIHRFICRILCCATPREALKIMFEKFCNRYGKVGGNIFRDRRIEF